MTANDSRAGAEEWRNGKYGVFRPLPPDPTMRSIGVQAVTADYLNRLEARAAEVERLKRGLKSVAICTGLSARTQEMLITRGIYLFLDGAIEDIAEYVNDVLKTMQRQEAHP